MNPFASIWEDRPAAPEKPKVQPKAKVVAVDHSKSRAIYAAYLKKKIELKKHQDYAMAVAKATDGPGMTPVMPLATMGTKGGPLLCDHCGKAIILETSPYYNVPADVAWARNAKRGPGWVSYIKGGLMVWIVDNGTLRIYHGYDGVADHCCTVAKAEMDAAEARHVRDNAAVSAMAKFLESEGKIDKLSDVCSLMFSFDPGIGVNRPEGT